MSVSMHDVRRVLDPDEPDYAATARLGPESLPHLRALVDGDDPLLASKAAYAAGLLEGDTGQEVITVAARSTDPALRVAAASAAVNLPTESAAAVLTDLVADADAGVRKVARSSVPEDAPEELAHRAREAAPPPEEDAGATPPLSPSDATQATTPMPSEHASSGLMPGEAGNGGVMPGEGGSGMVGEAPIVPGKMPGER
ncbi:HEAT repeat domain-containing protein [Streptomyces iconiensis]|uniref:HEAT repeat-containing protein n=1 Tax=Streptomyces iconiensis TaxID=1384038 RepID=A0ABT6ZUR7_9ACTN|nr:HEAT repeat domain-containing protein [Streptomyces iconiensis]MDJ1132812.1 hypothetical protein [Streptomyces iconiensis]